ncbi:hypothetical protein ACIQ6V_31970 [Streptomyces sp. NPDC096198]|uniref:hypothetical protein n=1 Tax=Streptomyces sp. NPDC096198 TaxID=3366080 RepID=UPI00380D6434
MCEQLENLCTQIADAPLEARLSTLNLLHHSFRELHNCALRAAATDARTAGWGLRRIGNAIGRSHEQVRTMTKPPVHPPTSRP